jgi:hypothetical protein
VNLPRILCGLARAWFAGGRAFGKGGRGAFPERAQPCRGRDDGDDRAETHRGGDVQHGRENHFAPDEGEHHRHALAQVREPP